MFNEPKIVCVGVRGFALVRCARVYIVQAGPFLSREQCGELAEAFQVYRSALNGLATEALDQGLLRWKVRPKLHMWLP